MDEEENKKTVILVRKIVERPLLLRYLKELTSYMRPQKEGKPFCNFFDYIFIYWNILLLTVNYHPIETAHQYTKKGNCRKQKDSQEYGDMWTIGANYKHNDKLFNGTQELSGVTKLGPLCKEVRKLMNLEFSDELQDIKEAEKYRKIPKELGGKKGVSCAMVVSRDLINPRFFFFFFCYLSLFFFFLFLFLFLFFSHLFSWFSLIFSFHYISHYDLDGSMSFNIWSEVHPKRAKNWYFILPNVLTADVQISFFFFFF